MSSRENREEAADEAWVTIQTPLPRDWMEAFIADVERVFRINSLMEFSRWGKSGAGQYQIAGKNLSNGKPFDMTITVEQVPGGIVVYYAEGLKTSTRVTLDPEPGSFTIRDDYSAVSRKEREARLDEVDKSLVQWGHDLHRYLKNWKRYALVPGYHWYMRRFWQPLKPSTRRICAMLIMVTVAEFILFLAVFSVFWLELDRFLD